MKIVLTAINAKYIHSNPAVYSLAAYAGQKLRTEEKEKCQLEIAEYTINHRVEVILAELYKKKPDVLAFSCYIWNWEYVQEMIIELNKLLPDTLIFLGGPEVSFTPKEILKQYPFLAGILIGEGEETFLELCRVCLKKGEIHSVSGMVTNKNMAGPKEMRETCAEPRGLININDIPFFYDNMEMFKNRIVYYESSRGCPYRCSYCLSSIDKTVRLRDLGLVKKELQFFLDLNIPQVKFIDRTFNCNREHACEIWQYICDHDNGITNFHFEISADIITDRELAILKKMRPGLVQLEIGVQSTNQKTIKEINRVMDVEKLRQVVARIHSFQNIHQHLDLIAGLPFEDYISFQNSFNEVYSMKPQQLQLGFLKVLKGAKMWEKAKEYGIVYTEKPPYEVLFTNWISYEEIRKLKQIEEMVEMYYNSQQFTYTMAMLVQEFESPFQMYEALAEFYEEKGYLLQNPARSYRYQILLDFCREILQKKQAGMDLEETGEVSKKQDMYRELLTFDLYLREKMKTRPSFAKSQEELKEVSREIYQREEEERHLLPGYREYNSKQMAKMTHLEEFSYAVWQQGDCKKLDETRLVIFDYNERNPLTAEAVIIKL